jgi:hypothetical protein
MSLADRRCVRCGDTRLVFPLHGCDQGGPLVCPKCASEIEKTFSYERNVWMARLGLKEKPRPRGPTYLTLELLKDILKLVHPDKHPPERAELAGRVTSELKELEPYTPPAPAQPPIVTAKKPSPCPTAKKPLRHGPQPDMKLRAIADRSSAKVGPSAKPAEPLICVTCVGFPPMYRCDSCRAKEEERRRKERERENAKARKRRARRRDRRLARQPSSICPECDGEFKPARKDARYCSNACRQRAHRRARRGGVAG